MADTHPTFEQISDLYHGTLDDEARAAVRAHVDTCPACSAVLQSLTAESYLIAAAVHDAESHAHETLVHGILSRTTRAPKRSSRRRSDRLRAARLKRTPALPGWALTAAAVAAAVIVVALFGGHTPRESSSRRRQARARYGVENPPAWLSSGEIFDEPPPEGLDVPEEAMPGLPGQASAPVASTPRPRAPHPAPEDVGDVAGHDATVPAGPDTNVVVDAPMRITALEGRSELRRAGSERWHDAYRDAGVMPGDTVRTKYSRVRLTFTTGTVVYVNRFTTFTLSESLAPATLTMAGGEVFVETSTSDSGFAVATSHGTVVDIGTKFGVEATRTGTRVVVTKGSVDASTDVATANVTTGREVLLIRRASPPGRVVQATGLVRRFSWTHGIRPAHKRLAMPSLVALYDFAEGGGTVVRNRSSVGTDLDLAIPDTNAVLWRRGGGLALVKPACLSTAGAPKALLDRCKATNEISVEAWVMPAQPSVSGPLRIVTLSPDVGHRNFTLGHGALPDAPPESCYVFRVRSTLEDANASPGHATPEGTCARKLTHVVSTRSADGTVRIYLDGVEAAVGRAEGDFHSWDEHYHLSLGDEPTRSRAFIGLYRLVAIYSTALTSEQIANMAEAGPPRGKVR